MLTVLSVVGTRPETIKMAPVIKEIKKHSDRLSSVVCSVGQHREMLDQVLQLFQIKPDYELDLMQANQTLSQLTAASFTGLDKVVSETKPNWVFAQGDTTTATTWTPRTSSEKLFRARARGQERGPASPRRS